MTEERCAAVRKRNTMIYNFNRGIGWASSGVEYAQAYRGRILRNAGVPCRFIYTDMFRADSLALLTENIGIPDEEVIWLYQFFTDFVTAGPSISIPRFEQDFLPEPADGRTKQQAYRIREVSSAEKGVHARREYRDPEGKTTVYAYYVPKDHRVIQKADFFCDGKLTHAEYYSYGRIFTEFFAEKDGKMTLFLRRFYNEDGSTAYEEFMDGERQIFRLKDRILYSKQELICEMVRAIPFQKGDVIVLDRTTELGQPVLRNSKEIPKICVIHAEHYSAAATTQQEIRWNNFYEYPFAQADRFVACITSTPAQAQLLRAQFQSYLGRAPRIEAIPVGSLSELKRPVQPRKAHSLCTASRLAGEKHIDLLIRAVAAAHERIPDVTLDIYGKGALEQELGKVIAENQTEAYIRLMGQHDMENVYVQYSGYIAASFSEGFGLSLMEAAGSGLAMIGFDVPYGNPTFIADKENGYLLPFDREEPDAAKIRKLTDAVIRLFTQADLEAFYRKSYEIAENYLEERVALKWKELLRQTGGET